MRFTFKTKKSVGRYGSFYPDNHYVKFKKQVIGMIEDKQPHRIRLKVIKNEELDDGNPNCEWMWITLKKESDSVAEAKEFLNNNIEAIMTKYKLINY